MKLSIDQTEIRIQNEANDPDQHSDFQLTDKPQVKYNDGKMQ